MYCKHNIQKANCSDCNTAEALLKSKRWCKICIGTQLMSQERILAGICAGCFKGKPERIEITVRSMLEKLVIHPWSSADDACLGGLKCPGTLNRRRPDMLWLGERLAIDVEIDEHSHGGYEVRCELAKITDFASVATNLLKRADIAVYVLRFNPHASICGTPLKKRVEVLANRINELFQMHDDAAMTGVPHVEYFFYGNAGQRHIEAARKAKDSMIVSEYPGHADARTKSKMQP